MAERRLVIVESPAKAKTIAGYLGDGYVVESSIGHIRDLPNRAADIPAAVKKEPWARLGVNVDDEFQPLYVVDPDKKKKVDELKRELKSATELLLATDEDREGEAIAWHLLEVLKPKVPVKRMVFHEITREAIERALGETREIDDRLVDAQETRRILDRLYGYEVSPVLWKKVMQGLSAGRVQSVATRLVVERERERMLFVAASYWDIVGTFEPGPFEARLVAVDGRRVAQGRDFGDDGRLKSDILALDEDAARTLAAALAGAPFAVRSVEEKPYTRRPAAPVHDVDAAAGGEPEAPLLVADDDARRPAAVRERLHHLHAHRLDDVVGVGADGRARAGGTAVRRRVRPGCAAPLRAQGEERAGGARGDPPRRRRVPHAGRRGARALARRARALRARLEADRRLADGGRPRADGLAATRRDGVGRARRRVRRVGHRDHVPRLPRRVRGGTRRRVEERRRRAPAAAARGRRAVEPTSLEPDGHSTSPPARYTEASLVKALEDRGIGRPSTYASIMGTILDRGYVFKKGTALVPTFLAFSVTKLLEKHFGRLVDYDFTARLEDDLDRIAEGDENRVDWLSRFYRGTDGEEGLHALVTDHLEEIDARDVNSIEIPGADGIVLRVGRYGPYLQRGEERASVPDDMAPDELTREKAEELLAKPSGDRDARGRSRRRAARSSRATVATART